MFAKIFDSEKYGQIVAMVGVEEDENPSVRFYAKPESMGVCMNSHVFQDTDEGYTDRDKLFESVDLARAEEAVSPIFALIAFAEDLNSDET